MNTQKEAAIALPPLLFKYANCLLVINPEMGLLLHKETIKPKFQNKKRFFFLEKILITLKYKILHLKIL